MINERNMTRVSAGIYTTLSLASALVFLLVTLPGDYNWVARVGGSVWVFALVMVILMPTVPALVKARVTGEPVRMPEHDHEAMLREQEGSKEMAKDPVCGMDVDPTTAAGSSEYQGKTYYFCNLNCKRSFDADPAKYLDEA